MIGFDPGRAEGITGGRRVIDLVEEAGVWFNAHAWSSAIVSAASLALSLTTPRVLVFELKAEENPMQHELVERPIGRRATATSRRSRGRARDRGARERRRHVPVLRPAGNDSGNGFAASWRLFDTLGDAAVQCGLEPLPSSCLGNRDRGRCRSASPRGTTVSSLTIAEIETIAIRVPLAQTYRGSAYKMTHRSTIVTRIRTEEGIVGEAYCGDEDAGLLEIDAILRTEIAPRLIGEDAFRVERCWELARPATFDILRDRRLGLVATACVDAAIWDAIGKALGQPLHRLWGGYRDSLP